MVFYRKYRPQKLSDLIGQEEIAKTLLSQLVGGKVSQGYLFWGPKGTGKTSTARILAKAVNCEAYGLPIEYRKETGASKKTVDHRQLFGEPCSKCANCLAIANGSFLDLIEIDAASNRGIDEIRDLREKVKLSPAVGRYKVYIIDEAHMLTNEAFNALLKTLEEPPRHVIFILATTEYSKLPPTIVSRLQKFNFKRARVASLVDAVLKVAKQEGIKIKTEAARAIASLSEGSFRDAVSILDQVSADGGEVNEDDVIALVQSSGTDRTLKFLSLVATFSLKDSVLFVDKLAEVGVDTALFVRQTVLFLEKILYLKIGVSADNIDVSDIDKSKLEALQSKFTLESLQRLIKLFVVAEGEMKNYPLVSIPVVLALCKWCEEESGGLAGSVRSVESPLRSALQKFEEQAVKPVETVKSVGSVSQYVGNLPEEDRVEENATAKKAEVKIKKIEQSGGKINKSGKVSFGEVEKSWDEFLNRVRGANAHVFALLKATKPAGYDGHSLLLEVFYRFHKDKLEEPRIIKMLDTTMAEILGKDIRLKFVLAKGGSQPTKTVIKSDVVDTRASELEQIAQEIFSK